MKDWLFVYGTLRRGAGSDWALRLEQDAEHAGPAITLGHLYDLGEYPGLVEGSDSVTGDLYGVSAGLLAELDDYEGAEFQRISTWARCGAGHYECWVYQYAGNLSGQPRIASGDWFRAR
jgi:gamma-glutamylcyclotransferase (GGCT)/AIG2-like uncharacterized protein YtfP